MPHERKNFLGLTPRQFMRRHWQKKPLLVRGALPQHARFIDRDALFALAGRDDAVARLVSRERSRWQVRHGPFTKAQLKRLPARGWSLLVQGVDLVDADAAALKQQFDFIPYARLDDVMVSYAPPGGGVGPHFDSYDVFLLQGAGSRRWQVSGQRDLELVPGAPLRILKRFRPQQAWTVETGDLLYLPPQQAHEGVAITGCVTISIGFRAPGAGELAGRFLDHLQDTLEDDGRYADPDLAPARHPAQIGDDMLRRFSRMLKAIRWSDRDVRDFAGRYLTEPKAHVVFERPLRPLSPAAFARAVHRHGLRLALPTSMLFHRNTLFVNGEAHCAPPGACALLKRLADRRLLPAPVAAGEDAMALLHEWYRAGYVIPGERAAR